MTAKPIRRYDFDWLKVLATLAVFFFHCARFFDLGEWHTKNNQLSVEMTTLTDFTSLWIMPLFLPSLEPVSILPSPFAIPDNSSNNE
ncbi:MAG: hypothetical protein HC769_03655 [Cyanobacteria bacterium CRU_2_1]|nr:hypothetical protein [Cyanobacteria bacterium CRU_2_1]